MMSTVTVQAVRTPRQRKAFLSLPWRLYRDDPLWVPPLRYDAPRLVGYRPHPFYASAACETFLAYRNGEVVGRVAAIENRAHNEYHNEQRGFFGFFECEDDPDAAAGLLEAARRWLAGRGLENVRGPANPSLNYTLGTLVDGFDLAPMLGLTYNLPYYGSLIESCGYRKTQDLFAYYGNTDMEPAVVAKHGAVADQIIERHDLSFRWLDRKTLRRDLAEFLSVFNRSLTAHWGFVPISPAELSEMARGLSWLLIPELVVGAEIDGELVGVSIVLPDYNPRIRRIRGRLFPLGFLHLILGRRRIRQCRVMTTNVLPRYQMLGIGLALVHVLRQRGLQMGLTEVEFSWIAESNSLSRGAVEKGGAERTKTYRVYDLAR